MPAGHKTTKTLAKEAAREVARELITRHLETLIDAQIANAKGIKYLVLRDKKTGKFLRVTQAMLQAWEDGTAVGGELIEVWEKDPSVSAFTDLMNRALDKPAEQVTISGDADRPLAIRWLRPDEEA